MEPISWMRRFAMPWEPYSPDSFFPRDLWGSIFLLCGGMSLPVEMISASWVWASLSVGIVAVLAYLVAYRGVLGIIKFALAALLGGAAGTGLGLPFTIGSFQSTSQPLPGFFWPLFFICSVGGIGLLFPWWLSIARDTLASNESRPEESSGVLEEGCVVNLLILLFFVGLPLLLLSVIIDLIVNWLHITPLYIWLHTNGEEVLGFAILSFGFVAYPISIGGSVAYVLWGIARHRRFRENAEK